MYGGTTLTPSDEQMTIPAYTDKQLTVDRVPTETKVITPSNSEQKVYPTTGKYINEITVNPSSVEITNGIIEEYYTQAGEISANTFVEFANTNYNTDVAKKTFSPDSTDFEGIISACELSPTRVFLMYTYDGYDHINTQVYGLIVTLGSTLTTTDPVLLLQDARDFSCCNVSNDKICITYMDGSFKTYIAVCTVSGNTISLGTFVSVTTYESSNFLKVIKCTDNKVLLIRTTIFSSSTNYSYAMVYNVSGNTISMATQSKLQTYSSVTGGYRDFNNMITDVIFDTENNIILCTYSTKSGAYAGILCVNFNPTNNTFATIEAADNAVYAPLSTIAKIDNRNYLFFYRKVYNGTYKELYAQRMYISDNKIVFETSIAITTDNGHTDSIKAFRVSDKKIGVIYQNSSGFVKTMISIQDDLSIKVGGSVVISSSLSSYADIDVATIKDTDFLAVEIDGTNINLQYSKNYIYIGQSSSKIDGVTKTTCSTTSPGQVYVLNK